MLIREGVVRHFKGVFQSSTVTPWDIRGRFPALTSVELEELTRAITDEETFQSSYKAAMSSRGTVAPDPSPFDKTLEAFNTLSPELFFSR
ncbi:hypothetical protein V6N12_045809 [Hibiscus sabdariffa]|uniref:Uncharacterized protein n=1 Tax=Hibiscus sabdariffa TaxID=183260 RepID=A0ABR2G4G3_9ROSI